VEKVQKQKAVSRSRVPLPQLYRAALFYEVLIKNYAAGHTTFSQ